MSTEPSDVKANAPDSTESAEVGPAPGPQRAGTGMVPTPTLVLGAILLALVAFGSGFLIGRDAGGGYGRRFGFAQGRFMRGAEEMPWRHGGEFGMPGRDVGSFGRPDMGGLGPMRPGIGGVVIGAVARVDGSTIYLETLRGEELVIRTDGSTFVRLTDAATISELAPGTTIVVAGFPGEDGTWRASRVLEGAPPWLQGNGTEPGSSSDWSG